MYRIKYCLLLIIFISPLSFSQYNEKELDNFLYKYYKNKNVSSVSGGVSVKGKIVWLKAEGYADLENLVPASPRTVYRIASVSKSMTGVAIMQLFEKKKLSLDDDIRKYLPWFPKKRWGFTIRQLLAHTSGIRTYRGEEFDSKAYFKSTREAIEYIAADSLEFQPGTDFLYTTLGYNILAGVIEAVAGQSYTDYMRANIFNPLAMNNTAFEYQSNLVPNRAHGYLRNIYRNFQNAPLADLSFKFAGGGVISTTEDLLKFGNGILSGKLLKKETIDTMLLPFKLKSGRYINYSLGFNAGYDSQGRKFFTHSGGGTGFCSQLIIYPEQELVSVYLINMRDRSLENPAFSFIKIVLDKDKSYPKIPISDRMMGIFKKSGLDSCISFFSSVKKDSSEFYMMDKDEINYFGQDLIAISRHFDAIKYYKFVLSDYPNEPLLLIGLGDAYFKDGNRGLALKYYRSAINSDPNNRYASDMVHQLEKQ